MSAIAVLVKTPGLSPVKTRLAEQIGTAAAEEGYRRCALAVASVAADANAGPVYFAVAETDGLQARTWASLPCLSQGEGSLGERMAHVHGELVHRHGAGLLLGGDAPQLAAASLRRAARWLEAGEPRGVLGPAADGGFWLFGANHMFNTTDWNAVDYSRADTLARLTRRFTRRGTWMMLENLTDLDTAGDITPVRAALRALPRPHPAQHNLLVWMHTHLPD